MPIAALALLAWPAIHRLFWPGYIYTYDSIYHLTRMTEVNLLVRQGIFYPRWFPDFGLGHGYPLFNFFPPFAYLLTELPALILGNLPLAIQVSIAASMLVSGWGMYALARVIGYGGDQPQAADSPPPLASGLWPMASRRLPPAFRSPPPLASGLWPVASRLPPSRGVANQAAAVVAAALYLYIPYHIQDVYTRGGLPELWAMAWLPWLCWAQIHGVRRQSAPWIALAGLLGAVEVATHNAVALFILPVAFVLSLAFSKWDRRSLLVGFACSALGLLFSAGYWLPAVVESNLTRVSQLQGDWLSQHTFDLSHLIDFVFFAPQGDQVYKLTILEAVMLVGLAAFALWYGFRRNAARPALAVVGLTLLLVFSLTRFSIPLWSTVPLVHYIQFPWRMLLLVGFLMAVMAAMAAQAHRFAWLPLAALTVAMAVSSLGQVQDRWFAPPAILDARTLEAQEFGSALDGVAIESEYQPQTSSPDVVYASQGRRAPEDATVAVPLQVRDLIASPTETRMTVSADEASRVRLQAFYFPGWHAQLDGKPWPLQPATPAGLIEAAVPAGIHSLDVTYAGTTLEGLAGLFSGGLLVLAAGWLLRRRPLILLPLLAIATASGVLLAHPPVAEGALNATSWSPSSGQALVGSDGPRVTSRGIEVDLFWLFSSLRESTFDFVLRDASGTEVWRMPADQAKTMPYEYLAANELLRRMYVLADPLPGTSSLSLETQSSSISLGQVNVSATSTKQHVINVPFEQQATLHSYSVERIKALPGLVVDDLPGRSDVVAHAGDFLLTNLQWWAGQTLDQNYVEFVHLVDAQGHGWAGQDNQPDAGLQATSSWSTGQTIFDRFLLRIPANAPPGMYRIELGMYHIDERGYHFLSLRGSGGNSVLFGTVNIQPASLASSPTIAIWQAPMSLNAWHASQQGSQLSLTFDWSATASMDRDYTLFVHLADASGAVLAQADAPPEGGLFPTSRWDPGDFVPDEHRLQAPAPGRYHLLIGWYDPKTGDRVALKSGGDTLDLGELEIR